MKYSNSWWYPLLSVTFSAISSGLVSRGWFQTNSTGTEAITGWSRELGTVEPSMLSNLLQDESNPSDSDLREIKFGFDKTVWSIYAFFKTMVLYPDVQAQAQAETDAVIGDNRLPMVEDHERLPFLSALAMEDMSWPQQAFHIVLFR
ncbi:hypothetical protein F5887DRAFT_951069 [Amanita rubescens]|nr:hypothetical protein F5887DRAFT_951069 [Amanita rubescens]